MLRCQDCEYYDVMPNGAPELTCDPLSTIKEPECLSKLLLVQLRVVADSHQATLNLYQRIAPLQEKMFRHVEREMDEVDEADRWKLDDDEDSEL